jgi:sugar-phosphatase
MAEASSMMIQCRGVLFDMDGVLVDSTPAVARVWTGWALEHGLIADEVIRKAHGRPSMATIMELLPNGDHDAENREMERREIEDIADVVALPGALALLQSIPPSRWTVVTSATRALAEVRLRVAGLPVPTHLVTSDDVKRGKPFPDPYLRGAEILRIPPAECIVAEDAASGVRAGKAAGARVLALRTTSTDAELQSAGADWIVDDLSAVSLESDRQDETLALLLRQSQKT